MDVGVGLGVAEGRRVNDGLAVRSCDSEEVVPTWAVGEFVAVGFPGALLPQHARRNKIVVA